MPSVFAMPVTESVTDKIFASFASPALAQSVFITDARNLRWFNDKQNYYRDVTTLLEENAALRKEIAKLEADLRQAADDRRTIGTAAKEKWTER